MVAMTKLLLLTLVALPLAASDAKSEVAQLKETMDRAYAAKDADTLAKCLTADYFAVAIAGVVRDRKSTLEFTNGTRPADGKREIVKTSVYGDTVIELERETWTANSGSKVEAYRTNVYVKQSGSWKQASRSGTTIPAPK
jgi:ketosteroid isomerase-like protein